MADTTKNIKFNFDDAGSLKKMKQMYEDLANTIISKSAIFGENYPGRNASQQTKYINDEINYLRKLTEERRKDFDERVKQFEYLRNREQGLSDSFRSGNIASGFYESKLNEISDNRRQLLRGTGYRKESTYLRGEGGQLSREEASLDEMEKLLENSNSILRDILSNNREEALRVVKAIEDNSESSPEARLAANQARWSLISSARSNNQTKPNIVADILTASNLNDLMGHARNIGTATDPISMMRATARAGFSAANAIGDAFGPIGGSIARFITGIADIALEQKIQTAQVRDITQQNIYGTRAMTGSTIYPTDTSRFGESFNQFTARYQPLASAAGSSSNLDRNAYNSLILNRALGISDSTITTLLELTRTNQENDKDLMNLVGGISSSSMFKGDRTFLDEFIAKNFTSLQKQLLQNQTTVASGTVLSLLNAFNDVGGQFGAKHPNSISLINSINNSLMNPGSDTMDALTFTALRRAMPGSSLLDILREREKGLGSDVYLKSFLNQMSLMGGGEDQQIMQLANAFGINLNAATDLYNNQDRFLNMSKAERLRYVGSFDQQAEQNTTELQKIQARFENNLVTGMTMEAAVQLLSESFNNVLNGRSFTYDVTTQRLTETYPAVYNPPKMPPLTKSTMQKQTFQTGGSFGGGNLGYHYTPKKK